MIIENIVIVLILVLCAFESISDLRTGLIKNKDLILFGAAPLILNMIDNLLQHRLISWYYWLVTAGGVAAAILLYALHVWAGGDSKLFAILALAFPFDIGQRNLYHIPLLFFIPILSFLYGYIYLIIDRLRLQLANKDKPAIKKMMQEEEAGAKKNTVKMFLQYLMNYLKYYVTMAFFSSAVFWVMNRLNLPTVNVTLIVLIQVVLIITIDRLHIVQNKLVVLVIAAADIVLTLTRTAVLLDWHFLLICAVIIPLYILRNWVEESNYEEIELGSVKPGMILSTFTSIMLANDRGCKYEKISDESLKSRLTQKDIDLILTISKKKQKQKVTILKKIPIASFISLGVLSVLIGGYFI